MPIKTFTKDPDATLDYAVDWSDWMTEEDEITSSQWIVPDGITEVASSNDATQTTIWLSGGTEGENYELVNRITTTNDPNRIDDRTILIKVRNR